MSTSLSPCDRDLLRQSLNDRLTEPEEEALARHLSACAACQRALEQLAAGRDDWSRVAQALKRDSAVTVAGDALEDRRAEDAAADFAVDFLEPTDKPGALGRMADIDIHELIGQGGMGVVLRGFQPELNRPVVVKVLAPHLATSGAARRRFAREAQAAAAIVHPHVMPILSVNSAGKLPFLVMPFVACESLQQRLDRAGPLETIDVLRIGRQTAGALAAAHAQGLVHRDVKPANILLERGVDRVLLTDFGLARAVDDATLTRSGVIAGTPQYMSPEQAKGEAIDARSDLFSLGSVLYALCAGRPPFRAESSYGILRRITDNDPRPLAEINPAVPEWLAAIIARLLAKRPDERYASAAEVADLLERCLAHVQQPTAVPLPAGLVAKVEGRPLKHAVWRRPMAWMLSAAAIAIVVASVALLDRPPAAERGNANTPEAAGQSNAGPPRAPTIDDPATEWDATSREINGLTDEADTLTPSIERLWDPPPAADEANGMPTKELKQESAP